MNSMQGNEKFSTILRLLRTLPKIKTGETFELRLRQRLSQPVEERDPLPVRPESFQFIPSMVYSAVALCLVVGLTYFLVTENGISPNIPSPMIRDSQSQISGRGTNTPNNENVGSEQKTVTGRSVVSKKSTETVHAPVKAVPSNRSNDQTNSRSSLSTTSAAVTAPQSPDKNQTRAMEAESGLVIDQKNTTTGVLELKRSDSLPAGGSKNRTITPNVRDNLGVGVLGQGLSSSLTDSLRIDSLRRIKKQLLMPKAIEKKPKE